MRNNNFSYRPTYGSGDLRRERNLLLAATACVAFLFIADLISGGRIRAVVRTVGNDIWDGAHEAVAGIEHSGIFNARATLAHENAMLKEQIAEQQDKSAAYAALLAENEQLRALVHLSSVTPGITAPVISSFRASPYGTFSIGAGSHDGVQKGSLVLTPDGFVIGRVSEVTAGSALVTQLFGPTQSIEAAIDRIPVILAGQGGGSAEGEAPRVAPIQIGDVAVAPSLANAPIGVVGNTQGSQASASTKVYVRLPVNLESLLFVYVEIAR